MSDGRDGPMSGNHLTNGIFGAMAYPGQGVRLS